jgi:hypothetical protein
MMVVIEFHGAGDDETVVLQLAEEVGDVDLLARAGEELGAGLAHAPAVRQELQDFQAFRRDADENVPLGVAEYDAVVVQPVGVRVDMDMGVVWVLRHSAPFNFSHRRLPLLASPTGSLPRCGADDGPAGKSGQDRRRGLLPFPLLGGGAGRGGAGLDSLHGANDELLHGHLLSCLAITTFRPQGRSRLLSSKHFAASRAGAVGA